MYIFRQRSIVIAGLSVFLFLLATRVAASENQAEEVEAQIRQALAEIDQRGIPVIVSYSIGDKLPVTQGFGHLKKDGIEPSQTQVDLLSITKSLTAISVLKLVEQRKLQLADTIDLYFTDIPEDKADITVHQLLTHSSGLLGSCGGDRDHFLKGDFLRCAFESPLLAEPGSTYNYSNVGYSLLAAIIEERTGKTFEAFFLEDVGRNTPLRHMGYESAIDVSHSIRSESDEPVSIASWGGSKPYWNLIGNGGFLSTPDEFLRFRQALSNGEIISLDMLKQAHTAHVPEDDSGMTYYGYGVVVQDRSSVGPLVWHNGGSDEFSSEWNDLEEFDLTIFAAGYQSDGESAYTAIEILWANLRKLRN